MKKKLGSALWLGLILLFLYLPILILAVYSFTDSTMIGSIRGFSIENYKNLVTNTELLDMISGTFLLAFGVAVISTVLGTIGAVGAYYSKRSVRTGIELANQIPVVNADVVTGFSVCILLIVFFGMKKESYIPMVIGHTVLCTPFVYLSVLPRLKQMDPHLYEVALDLGCTPTQALIKVVFRELIPGILSGFMTSVTLSLDDYFITTYTKPAAFDTISTYVVNATRGAQTEIKTALWALSTLIFLVVVVAVVIMNWKPKYKRKMKAVAMLFLMFAITGVTATGCKKSTDETMVLRVANWEEYIDEGDWDEEETIELEDGTKIIGVNNMTEDFEEWYKETYGEEIRVEYSTFGSNEELYNQMSLGDTFDLICPSEYMIMKLMQEERLHPLSEQFFKEDEKNYYKKGVSPYIRGVFDDLQIGEETISKYAAGYMWGTMGIVYNPEEVDKEDTKHWNMLLNEKYNKRITMKDGVRDSYIVALAILQEQELMELERNSVDYGKILSEKMNDTKTDTVQKVEGILSKMRENAYSIETDSGKADMVTGKVVANMQWSGDAVYTLDQAEEDDVYLNYFVPEEGTNLWFDGWCMMKDGIDGNKKKQQAAEAFINYLSKPENAIRNMYYIGYTSVIAGGESDMMFQYADYYYGAEEDSEDTVEYPLGYFFEFDSEKNCVLTVDAEQQERQLFAQYPPEEVIQRSAVMKCFDKEANKRISQMWTNIRCFDWGDLF